MNYTEIVIETKDTTIREKIVAELSLIGFDGFEETDELLKAFIKEEEFDENALSEIIGQYNLTYSKSIIAQQNWNELWESSFQPVIVEDPLTHIPWAGIRAHFHVPLGSVEHEIVITPKMSFGTGHHATTYLVMQLMKGMKFTDKSVFDFGTGTGILSILAEKLGAKEILAVDNDPICIENSIENAANNGCRLINIQKAGDVVTGGQFDIIIANINKNILLDNLTSLHAGLANKGQVILSGLLTEDEADMLAATGNLGWKHLQTARKSGWIALHFSV